MFNEWGSLHPTYPFSQRSLRHFFVQVPWGETQRHTGFTIDSLLRHCLSVMFYDLMKMEGPKDHGNPSPIIISLFSISLLLSCAFESTLSPLFSPYFLFYCLLFLLLGHQPSNLTFHPSLQYLILEKCKSKIISSPVTVFTLIQWFAKTEGERERRKSHIVRRTKFINNLNSSILTHHKCHQAFKTVSLVVGGPEL